MARDKASLDIFWLKDESLEGSANLPDPDIISQEIVDDLEAALDSSALSRMIFMVARQSRRLDKG